MEKNLNKLIEQYIVKFKEDLKTKINELDFSDKSKAGELVEYIFEYEKLAISKDDFVKRNRIKNTIPNMNRCTAKLANGEQCTRTRRQDSEFCGTHHKFTPYGKMSSEEKEETNTDKTVEIMVVDIQGIIYYMDKFNNVYNITDILEKKENPQIVGKYKKNGTDYTITYL